MADSNLGQLNERRQSKHKQDLDFIVSLGNEYENRGRTKRVLIKKIKNPQEMKLDEIIDYILDPREDESNPAYNQDEIRHANRIKEWRASAKASADSDSPELVEIYYIDSNQQISIPIKLSYHISDYPHMVKEKTKRIDSGEEIRYNGVDLILRLIPGQ